MKKLKSRFDVFEPVGMAGINKILRQDMLTFKPIKISKLEIFIGQIQNFYQLILQNLKV